MKIHCGLWNKTLSPLYIRVIDSSVLRNSALINEIFEIKKYFLKLKNLFLILYDFGGLIFHVSGREGCEKVNRKIN